LRPNIKRTINNNMAEVFLIEIETKHGSLEFTSAWLELQGDSDIKKGIQNGVIRYLFKVAGENKVVMVVKCDGPSLDELLLQYMNPFTRLKEGCKQTVTTLIDYEQFATTMSALAGTPATFDTLPTKDEDDTGLYFMLDIKIEYRKIKQEALFKTWAEETKAALGAKEQGIVVDIWKRAGERRIFTFVKVDKAMSLEYILFSLPMMKEMGDQMEITTKRITKLNTI
jgi:muconolactone delta-isomerase